MHKHDRRTDRPPAAHQTAVTSSVSFLLKYDAKQKVDVRRTERESVKTVVWSENNLTNLVITRQFQKV